jgi:hypothetical protein
MAFTTPYKQHNYMGEWANTGGDAEAAAGIAALGFTVANGMWYYDTSNNAFRVRQGGAWATLQSSAPATPTLAAVLGAGNQSGGSDLVIDTGDVLTITDAPLAGTDAANKAYVDGVAVGLSWKSPAYVLNMLSNADQSGTTPTAAHTGEAWVVNGWATPWDTEDGTIVEWDGSQWNSIVPNVAGEPPDGMRVVTAQPAWGPSGSFNSHGNHIAAYDATLNSWSFTVPSEGDALLIVGNPSIYENKGYTYDAASFPPWIQFTGIAELIAGLGLSKSGVTVSVKADEGAIRTADGSEEILNNPLYLDSTNGLNVKVDNSTIGLDSANDYRLYIPNGGITGTQLNASVAGAGLTGGGGSALAVGAGNGISVAADTVAVSPANTATKGGCIVDSDGVYTTLINAGNPNGVVSGDFGQHCYDSTGGLLYMFSSPTAGNNSWIVV